MTLREWFDEHEISDDAIIEFYVSESGEIGDFHPKFYEDLCTKYKHCKISDLSTELLNYEFDIFTPYMSCPDFIIYDNKYVYTLVLCTTYWHLMRLNRNPIYGT